MSKYSEKLKDPRWQKKRLEILQRDNWCCQGCFDESSTLNVHHKIYKKNHNIWDYEDDELITLCEKCHDIEHKMRSIYESVLLKFISKKFLANDLISIIETFENIKIKYHSDVTATMLRFAVSSQDVWEK